MGDRIINNMLRLCNGFSVKTLNYNRNHSVKGSIFHYKLTSGITRGRKPK
ncbi:hypothetical protein Hanom_Chr05g00451531 [Helianthus anomalus]